MGEARLLTVTSLNINNKLLIRVIVVEFDFDFFFNNWSRLSYINSNIDKNVFTEIFN